MSNRHQIIQPNNVIAKNLAENYTLNSNEIHVWKSELNDTDELLNYYCSLLSEDEIERSGKFKFTKHRNFYITGRAKLRQLISQYISIKPSKIKFTYNKYGKPYLHENSLKFNISHSGNKVLFSFNTENEIGADIELINKNLEIYRLVNRFFSLKEANTIVALDPENAHDYFFRCWTRKEAFIKAHGQGLSLPLDQFQVSILQDNDVEIEKIKWNPTSIHTWQLYSFAYSCDSVCAVALNTEQKKKLVHFKF
jgi:4'-phosphopantetheinyl transferase